MSKFDLNKHTARLLLAEPFFASISRRIDKTASTAIPTAGVRLNKSTGYFEMLYNPEFFEGLPDVQKLGVLKHEFYHLILQHTTTRNPDPDGKVSKAWNVATDLSINSHLIGELPENGCIPSQKDSPFEDYPVGLSAEAYLKMIKDDPQFQPDEGDGDPSSGGGMGKDKVVDYPTLSMITVNGQMATVMTLTLTLSLENDCEICSTKPAKTLTNVALGVLCPLTFAKRSKSSSIHLLIGARCYVTLSRVLARLTSDLLFDD